MGAPHMSHTAALASLAKEHAGHSAAAMAGGKAAKSAGRARAGGGGPENADRAATPPNSRAHTP